VQSVFAFGLAEPTGLVFNSAGDLFESDTGSGNIYKFSSDGTRSVFASGLNGPFGLVFEPVPEPSILGLLAVSATTLLICRRKLKLLK
jgi:hypothetical protein